MQSDVINRLRSAIAYVEADKAQDYAHAETTGERVDLNDYDISLPLEDAKALEAALSAAEPVGVRCKGCGSSWDDERLAAEKAKRPELISCCPERKMIPVYAAPPAPSLAVKAWRKGDDHLISTLESFVEDNIWSGWAIKQAIEIIRKAGEDLPFHCDVCTVPGYGDAPCSPSCDRSDAPNEPADAKNLREALSGVMSEFIATTPRQRRIERVAQAALSAQVQDVERTVEAFDRDHPELYWHIAKGKITAGEPLYGAIITDLRGNELGHGESDASAVDAFNIAVASSGLPAAPAKQEGGANE